MNGFSPAIGNSFQVMTFGSRTGQFATINGTALGNPFCFAQGTRGKQFSLAYSATSLTLNVTAPSTHSASLRAPAPAQGTRAAPIPALPDSDGDGFTNAEESIAGTNPFDAASKPEISSIRSGTDGVRVAFATVPGRTCRLECSEDLTTNQWTILFDHIGGTGDLRTLIDPLGTTRPKCFYRIVITAQ